MNAAKSLALSSALVDLTMRPVVDEGPEPGWTPILESEIIALVNHLHGELNGGPLWVFGYGSLIWNPGFKVKERQNAKISGWHRAFSLEIERWRATTHQPGLMLALEPGGSCRGVVLQADPHGLKEAVDYLVRREIRYSELASMVRWMEVQTALGSVRALTFWAGAKGRRHARLSLEEVARRLARACGPAGSCAEYLRNTVVHLERAGIRDRNLWKLQTLVATEIQPIHRSGDVEARY